MDIKNAPALYGKTVGIENFDLAPVERSKDFLLSGVVEYEFRTTVVRGLHTRESLIEAALDTYIHLIDAKLPQADELGISLASDVVDRRVHGYSLHVRKIFVYLKSYFLQLICAESKRITVL
jgi:hypothetical protein